MALRRNLERYIEAGNRLVETDSIEEAQHAARQCAAIYQETKALETRIMNECGILEINPDEALGR